MLGHPNPWAHSLGATTQPSTAHFFVLLCNWPPNMRPEPQCQRPTANCARASVSFWHGGRAHPICPFATPLANASPGWARQAPQPIESLAASLGWACPPVQHAPLARWHLGGVAKHLARLTLFGWVNIGLEHSIAMRAHPGLQPGCCPHAAIQGWGLCMKQNNKGGGVAKPVGRL